MKIRAFFYPLIAVVLILLLSGAGGLAWIVSRSPLDLLQGGVKAVPTTTMFVSKQAPLMVSLLVNPDRLATVRQVFTRPGQRRQAAAEIERLRRGVLSRFDLDYQTDVQPWLGSELTWAVTTPDVDRDAINGKTPGYLLALSTADPARSQEFLRTFWQKQAQAGADLVFEQYAGVKLIYKQSQLAAAQTAAPGRETAIEQVGIASAMISDRVLLFANHPKVLREAITNIQAPDLSLEKSPRFQEALEDLPEKRIGVVYGDLKQLSTWLDQTVLTGDVQLDAASSSLLYDSVVASVALDAQGVRFDTLLLTAAGATLQPIQPLLSAPVDALQYLPSDSAFVAAGKDLGATWARFKEGVQSYPSVSALAQRPLSAIENRWQLDLPQDIFAWTTDRFALSVDDQDSPQPEWIFVAERSNEQAAAGIAHLDTLAAEQGLSVGEVELNQQPVTAWTRLSTVPTKRRRNDSQVLQAEIAGAHTTTGDYEMFASSLKIMEQALQDVEQSMLQRSDFQAAIASLADDNDGYVYLDWPSLRQLLSQRSPLVQLLDAFAQPLTNHLESVTLSTYGRDRTQQPGGIFIHLSDF